MQATPVKEAEWSIKDVDVNWQLGIDWVLQCHGHAIFVWHRFWNVMPCPRHLLHRLLRGLYWVSLMSKWRIVLAEVSHFGTRLCCVHTDDMSQLVKGTSLRSSKASCVRQDSKTPESQQAEFNSAQWNRVDSALEEMRGMFQPVSRMALDLWYSGIFIIPPALRYTNAMTKISFFESRCGIHCRAQGTRTWRGVQPWMRHWAGSILPGSPLKEVGWIGASEGPGTPGETWWPLKKSHTFVTWMPPQKTEEVRYWVLMVAPLPLLQQWEAEDKRTVREMLMKWWDDSAKSPPHPSASMPTSSLCTRTSQVDQTMPGTWMARHLGEIQEDVGPPQDILPADHLPLLKWKVLKPLVICWNEKSRKSRVRPRSQWSPLTNQENPRPPWYLFEVSIVSIWKRWTEWPEWQTYP